MSDEKLELGIEALKKVVDLGCELIHIGEQVVKNGKNIVADISEIVSELPDLSVQVPAVIAAWPSVMPEVKDLDTKEAAEIVAYTMLKLSVSDEKAVKIVNASIKLIFDGIDLFKSIKG